MTLPIVIVKDYLVSKGFAFGGTANWAIYVGKMPTTPTKVVTLYEGPSRTPNPRWLLDYPSIQIKVRGGPNDYVAAREKIQQIKDLLLGVEPFDEPGGDRLVSVQAIGDVAELGFGAEPQDVMFVLNLTLIVEPAPNANTNRDPL